MARPDDKPLRRGWTTGACAVDASRAVAALLTGAIPESASIRLPRGDKLSFPPALRESGTGWSCIGVVEVAAVDRAGRIVASIDIRIA